MFRALPFYFLLLTIPCFSQSHDSPEFYFKVKRKKIDVIRRVADFKPGESVADVGAGEGWLDAAFGVYADGVRFSLEDVDGDVTESGKLQQALAAFAKLKMRPITCIYQQSTGTDSSTGLASGDFNTILLVDAFHHLKFRDEMIADMKRIIKPGGKVVVYELVARRPGQKYRACKLPLYTREEIVSSFQKQGFLLDGVFKTVNSRRTNVRVFRFKLS